MASTQDLHSSDSEEQDKEEPASFNKAKKSMEIAGIGEVLAR